MTRLAFLLAVAVATLWTPITASAAGRTTPEEIQQALAARGMVTTLGKDEMGDPKLSGEVDEMTYSVIFDNCNAKKVCEIILFRTGFIVSNRPSADKLNDWNQKKLIGRAYFDSDGDPSLDFVVTIEGGVNPDNIASMGAYWRTAIRQYAKFIGYK